MPTPLRDLNAPSFINFSKWLISKSIVDEEELLDGQEIIIDEEDWSGQTSTSILGNRIQFLTLKSEIKNDFDLTFQSEKTSGFFSSFYVERGEPALNFLNSEMTSYNASLGVMYCPIEGTYQGRYKGGSIINVVDIKAPLGLIESTLEGPPSKAVRAILAECFDENPIQPFHVNHEMRRLINAAVFSDLNGPLRQLQLEGIAIQLIAHQLHAIQEGKKPLSLDVKLSSKEKKRLEEARELLLDDLRDPPTLAAMARSVDLSEKKLSIGFKLLFGETPFELLRRQRLEVARQALTEDVPLKQIAHRVGYNHVTNFINAFTKHFGKPPRQYQERVGS